MNNITQTAEDLIRETFAKENDGMINQDLDLLKEVIAPDAILTHITGAEQSRDEWLRQIKIGRMRYKKSILQKVAITILDENHAHAIVQNLVTARIYGFTNDWLLQSDNQLEKRNGNWVITGSKASLA
ncbi:nuclear transport factor 2 family protein [Lactobacillus hamsteri]|uniref:DUF4440 domain-containing protein n=1 Tax=Lactobacillus hamsteri DSM 5661 = JCM 6256 TaxID=1423754 RepID=A0A0R1Y9C7_9LACO|nr:nuclear transport factor 2 family protein [Lactobacillus hamsteri]KRM38501.1 hypothetical protein FC39_GL001271 [Lactobacillus hamsteri DSM 5661 = JCM 6256]